jgi:hypothetical protein
MRQVARRLGASHMRVLGGLGGLIACAGAGVAVAASPKPGAAPLTPPVNPAAALDRPAPAASPAPCATNGTGVATTSGDPVVTAALRDLRAAQTSADRQLVLRRLSPDQRQQVTALMRARPQPTPGCGAPMIQPEVVSGGPTAPPITNSYVS